MPSFPRKRESILLCHKFKMDSRFRGNDVEAEWVVTGDSAAPRILIPPPTSTKGIDDAWWERIRCATCEA